MAERHKRTIELFDVDGTLTVPRQVRKMGEPAPPAVEFLQELRQVSIPFAAQLELAIDLML